MSVLPVEPYVVSSWAAAKGLTHCFVYHGASMIPTFHNGDFLYVRSGGQKLTVGDVVVFSNSDTGKYVVHRVVSLSGADLITRGDHNHLCDPLPVSLKQVVGRVDFLENRRGIFSVRNGRLGTRLAQFGQKVYLMKRSIRAMFRKPYGLLKTSRLVAMIWRPKIIKMRIQTEQGPRIKYLYNMRTVAVWDPTRQYFECRKPFDLILPSHLDEKRS